MKLICVFLLSLCTFNATATIIEISGSGTFTDFIDKSKDQVIALNESFAFYMVFNTRNIEGLNSTDINLFDPNLQVSGLFSSDITGMHEPTIGRHAVLPNWPIESYFLNGFPDNNNYKLVFYGMEISPLADYRTSYLSPSSMLDYAFLDAGLFTLSCIYPTSSIREASDSLLPSKNLLGCGASLDTWYFDNSEYRPATVASATFLDDYTINLFTE